MDRDTELKSREEYIKSSPLEDYLTEDPEIHNQKYFVLSYLLPNKTNELEHPIIKVRGSYKSYEECEKRVNKLKSMDSYFNMYICEVGKYGSLMSDDEIKKTDDIDIQYRESVLNNMVKEYNENKDKADSEFEKRKQLMLKKAKLEGSKEGQELLKSQKENPMTVKTRIETVSKHKKQLEEQMNEINEILRLSEEQLKEYSPEEIEMEGQKMKEVHKELFTTDDLSLDKK